MEIWKIVIKFNTENLIHEQCNPGDVKSKNFSDRILVAIHEVRDEMITHRRFTSLHYNWNNPYGEVLEMVRAPVRVRVEVRDALPPSKTCVGLGSLT